LTFPYPHAKTDLFTRLGALLHGRFVRAFARGAGARDIRVGSLSRSHVASAGCIASHALARETTNSVNNLEVVHGEGAREGALKSPQGRSALRSASYFVTRTNMHLHLRPYMLVHTIREVHRCDRRKSIPAPS
jgi:hypothetical protein